MSRCASPRPAGSRRPARALHRNTAMRIAVLFDLDGTLVDTNDLHVRAWHAALRAHGFGVAPDRIAVEVGKGGDQLVPDLLGEGAEREAGEPLRRAHGEAFAQRSPRPTTPWRTARRRSAARSPTATAA
jgi:beta-phosphoglucomutase-like phosphatase (HAD superfamily)